MTLRDLKNIYLETRSDFLASPLSAFTTAILESRPLDLSSDASFEALVGLKETNQTPFALLAEGYQLLSLALIRILAENPSAAYEEWLQAKISDYIQVNTWAEFQLLAVLKAILANLIDQPLSLQSPQQLKGGAAFLEWKGLWSWGKATHGHLHADLGCLWGLFGYLSQDNTWIEAAKEIANWQLNTLNVDFFPVRSLFTLEENALIPKILISNYLLFYMIAALTGDKHFKFAAKKQLEHLNRCQKVRIPHEALLMEAFLKRIEGRVSEEEFVLQPWISDQEVGLLGFRSPTETVFCLGKGGQTGLGYVNFSDIGIVNYGPQHLPLGDCQTFGIEESGFESATCQLNPSKTGFHLSSTARLTPKKVDLDSFANFRNGIPSNIWVDLKHTFTLEEKKLVVAANFFSLQEMQELAFVFFVTADCCELEKGSIIYPKTFVHYRGLEDSLIFKRGDARLSIKAQAPLNVEVIPLSGGENFWGADFLVAYPVHATLPSIEWTISKI